MARTRNNAAANVGYETELWQMADALRGSMDAAEYKHVVLGLIFLKYISDAFEEQRAKLETERALGADPEDPDEYRALNIFWVPPEARWSHLKAQAKQPTIGQLVDDAMAGIERDNLSLKGVLPKDYARPALDKQRLGQIIDLISNIKVGDAESRSKDVLGQVYQYFLKQFALAEGRKGASSGRPRASCGSWLRCSNHTRVVSMIHAAEQEECSSSRSGSSRRTRMETATAAGPRPTSASTARNRTTPLGGWL
jgi:type I restriction enzyme M protein